MDWMTALGSAPPRPELLAPAGDAACAAAAVENGADAVYFGLRGGLNARARAVNFAPDELPELMGRLHRRGVKGYLALNTLVFQNELPALELAARQAVDAGVDAVLVQDLGAARLIRAVCPDWPVHASTQMSLTSAEGIRVAESLGLRRVVLARELSLAEIRQIRGRTSLGLEVFVHGALCISVSGQCMASFALGGRSGNRGQCAQPCRLPYQLICDGRALDLGDRKYLLSPQDLAAYDLLPELLAAGVDALKIEGRLKSAEYVAAVTRHYRTAIDAACAGHPAQFTPQQIAELEAPFSRGFSHGWLDGCDHKALVPGESSAKRGVYLGQVQAVTEGRALVALAAAVRRGDGVVFEGDRPDDARQGGRVYGVFCQGQALDEPVAAGLVELSFGRDDIELDQLRPGLKVWKTDDPQLTRRLRKTYAAPRSRRRVPLDLTVEASVGGRLCIAARADSGAACRIESPHVLAEARKHPLTAEVLAEQLGRLGGTAYELRRLEARIEGRPMAPLSVLGQLRHALVEELDASLARRPPLATAADSPLPALLAKCEAASGTHPPAAPRLHVLCRQPAQIEAVLAAGVASLIADFEDPDQYPAAVESAHAREATILLATPRIQKPGEMESVAALLHRGADGILARNLAAAALCAAEGVPFVADFSLHAANALTVQFLHELGACRVTAAYDCPREQLFELAAATPAGRLEVVAYQHMPMFHTQHCLFSALLSSGGGGGDCGRPCRRHAVRLRDRLGVEHPLRAGAACRNTVFHARPQDLADAVPSLLKRGVRHFRLELLDETQGQIARLLQSYREVLA
jgi:putative protease